MSGIGSDSTFRACARSPNRGEPCTFRPGQIATEPCKFPTAEHRRLAEDKSGERNWKQWGPYLSERQWGTVREDYSPDGNAWDYFPHDQARSRAYRWGEDGIAGVSDDQQRLCLALALWNGRDPILKERLFGLTNSEGNHGEDVKELLLLPRCHADAFVPEDALQVSAARVSLRAAGRGEPAPRQGPAGVRAARHRHLRRRPLLRRVRRVRQGGAGRHPHAASRSTIAARRRPTLHLLPQLWFRNTWSWNGNAAKPTLSRRQRRRDRRAASRSWATTTSYADGEPTLLFCDNETNARRLLRRGRRPRSFQGRLPRIRRCTATDAAVNPGASGHEGRRRTTQLDSAGGRHRRSVRLRLSPTHRWRSRSPTSTRCVDERRREADEFYAALAGRHRRRRRAQRAAPGVRRHDLEQAVLLLRRAASGCDGDPAQPPPPAERRNGRNRDWQHLNNADIISMPDKWEYPWYAAWDLAFHCIPLALVDAEFAKQQLVLLTREWYMHPNGQLPAYEWAFGDVNPPVHAWATWRVFQIDRKQRGDAGDLAFLERVFHKLHAQLHLVGEPQGRAGPQHLPGRLPRARQHRRLRPQRAAADRRLHQSGRRHQLDGDVLPEPACASRSSWRCTIRSTRTSPRSSSSTSCTSPRR